MKKKILFILWLFIGSWSFAQDADCSFGLKLSAVQAEVGDIVTIDVTSRQFNEIMGMQYTHQWNPAKLEFVDIVYPQSNGAINATYLNFGEQGVESGWLTFTFFDNMVQGITIEDNTILYSLRFIYLQAQEALIQINGSQTQIEVIDLEGYLQGEVLQNYYFISGVVTELSEVPMFYPNLSTACLSGGGCGTTDEGQINIDITGEGLSFDWQGDNGFQSTSEDISALGYGHYTLKALQTNQQAVYADFYLGESQSSLRLNFTVDNDECGGTGDGAITSSVIGGSGHYTYEWSNGESSANLNNLTAGIYSLTVTDNDDGCSANAQVEVESPITLWITEQTTPASCSTASDGSINLTVDGPDGSAPFSYEWTNGATTEDLDHVESGLYLVTITTSTGCSSVYATAVGVDQPDINAVVTGASCENTEDGSIALDIDENDFDILWSNGATTATITDLSPGFYSVSLTELSSACIDEYPFVVTNTLDTPISYNLACNGDNAEIQLIIWDINDAPYTLDWSNGAQTTTSVLDDMFSLSSIIVSENGAYAVTVTGASGCSQTIDDLIVDCPASPITLSLSPAQSTVDAGAQVCLDVKVDEFVDQIGFQFTITWDESLLSFVELTDINVPELGSTNYGTSLTDDGVLPVSWNDAQTQGVSLPANASLFSVCFEAVSEEDVTTTVDFQNFPAMIEFIDSNEAVATVNTQNAQIILNGGIINPQDEFSLSMDQVQANPGSIVCVPVKSSEFYGLGGVQLSMKWDEEALVFSSIQNISLEGINFNTLAERELDGVLRALWQNVSLDETYIADNTTLFEVCFTAQGQEGVYPISFSEGPIPAIAGTTDTERIDPELTNGSVTISSDVVNQGVTLRIATAAVDVGGNICLPIYADNLTDLLAMQFSIVWDQELISLDRVELLDNLPGLDQTDYNLPVPDGVFTFAWLAPSLNAVSLPTGTPIFEFCFTANQQEGVAGVNFSNEPTNIEFINADQEVINFVPANGQLIISSENLVWPGDTDVNALVNHFDVLNIGLAYGAQGAARNNASTNWLAQFVQPWGQSTPLSNVDYRFMDTDGNGEINTDDIRAIIQNWDETTEEYTSTDGTSRTLNAATIPFYIQADTALAGASVSLPIMLGVEDALVENVYGVAFSIHYDPELVRPESAEILFNGWLASPDNILGVYRDYHGYGRIDVAMVRKDGQNITSQGQIGEFIIIMEDVIFRDKIDVELLISIDNVRLINAQEEEMLTSPRETTVLVENITNTNETFELQSLQLSPNPTNKAFSIHKTNVAIQSISIFNSRGQLQQKMEDNADSYNIEHLPVGVYWLKFQTDKGIAVRKLIKF